MGLGLRICINVGRVYGVEGNWVEWARPSNTGIGFFLLSITRVFMGLIVLLILDPVKKYGSDRPEMSVALSAYRLTTLN